VLRTWPSPVKAPSSASPKSSLGIIPGAGGTALLPRLVGKSLAMQMVLTASRSMRPTARSAGLILEIVRIGKP